MGDWFDTPVHQESEWWMSVQERWIYRQTNGEWSQYAHQNFSRLWFSTSKKLVPCLDQCSQYPCYKDNPLPRGNSKSQNNQPYKYSSHVTPQLHIRNRALISRSPSAHSKTHRRHSWTTNTITIWLRGTSGPNNCHRWLSNIRGGIPWMGIGNETWNNHPSRSRARRRNPIADGVLLIWTRQSSSRPCSFG
jgi:hypothetical protein